MSMNQTDVWGRTALYNRVMAAILGDDALSGLRLLAFEKVIFNRKSAKATDV